MSIIFKPKRSDVASAVPSTAQLADGELAVNTADKKIYIRVGAAIVELFKSLTKSDVGLSNVDNTSDANKPISTATQTALNGKVGLDGTGATGFWNIDVNYAESAGTASLANVAASLDVAAEVPYGQLTGVPSTFAPSAHSHAVSDVTGLQTALDAKAPLASPALTGTPSAPTAAAGTNTTQLATTAFVQAATKPVAFGIACSDETTAITAGTGKATFRMPMAITNLAVRASLGVAQASGAIFTIDINVNGASILSTKLTIDNTEKTSLTAAAAAVLTTTTIADDAEVTIDVDQVGTSGAKGLKVWIIGRAP